MQSVVVTKHVHDLTPRQGQAVVSAWILKFKAGEHTLMHRLVSAGLQDRRIVVQDTNTGSALALKELSSHLRHVTGFGHRVDD